MTDECMAIADGNAAKLEQAAEEPADTSVSQLKLASILLGSILATEAYLPVTVWFLFRNDGVNSAETLNPWYTRAWKWTWMSHFFVFGFPTMIWPFTYLGSQVVNDFYILVLFWVNTIFGGAMTGIGLILWFIAWAAY